MATRNWTGSVHPTRKPLARQKGKTRVDKKHISGDIIIVRGVILDSDRGDDWQVPFVAFLTIKDDLIAEDYTYADFTKLRTK